MTNPAEPMTGGTHPTDPTHPIRPSQADPPPGLLLIYIQPKIKYVNKTLTNKKVKLFCGLVWGDYL